MRLQPWLRASVYGFTALLGLVAGESALADELGGESPCADCQADDCGCEPLVYGYVDALFLARDNRTSINTAILAQGETVPVIGTPLQTSDDPRFNMEPGVSALLGIHVDDCRAWEFGYFGILDWNAASTVTGTNSLAIPGDLGLASLDYFASDRISLLYTSRLHNAEFNHVWAGECYSFLAGFRYLSLDESFVLNSTDGDTGSSDYRVRTSNDLYGGQIGARTGGDIGQLTWLATAKAGVFGNDAFQGQSVSDFPPGFFLRPETGRRSGGVAFVSDVNLTLAYAISENITARLGYSVLFIEGVALAPDQLDYTDIPTSGQALRRSGLFAHGVNAGLGFSW